MCHTASICSLDILENKLSFGLVFFPRTGSECGTTLNTVASIIECLCSGKGSGNCVNPEFHILAELGLINSSVSQMKRLKMEKLSHFKKLELQLEWNSTTQVQSLPVVICLPAGLLPPPGFCSLKNHSAAQPLPCQQPALPHNASRLHWLRYNPHKLEEWVSDLPPS